ncbi:hypothetical protein O181_041641 [Austropuccinia psidii MF-1]|uniref:Lactoylglutathione lyase n=1 Tax=Austropuccinia psidii MF-1 TaxID=1389203 RepID=A0A9Q3HEF0_9BASI|nr:hypothetical protein [Austropuccinia psidii MF-1]
MLSVAYRFGVFLGPLPPAGLRSLRRLTNPWKLLPRRFDRHVGYLSFASMPSNRSHFSGQQNFKFNHTMFRIKDPKLSLAFYQNILGMELLHKMDVEVAKFTNYFLAFPCLENQPENRFQRQGLLELCHNWGTESDPQFKGYHNGNQSPQGFGHIAITCDDIQKTCAYLEENNVKFQKRLTDGRMKNIAFALDPDGYWIEFLENNTKDSEIS